MPYKPMPAFRVLRARCLVQSGLYETLPESGLRTPTTPWQRP